MTSDIFAGQPSDPDLLAELYDLEHDQVAEDHAFYREMARRSTGPAVDLGCGSGRLFEPLLSAGDQSVVGVDGSAALLRRARSRIESSPRLADAERDGRLRLVKGDVRRLDAKGLRRSMGRHAGLVVMAGVLPHLDGPEEALRMLGGVAALLQRRGFAVIDDLGPALLPARDLPLSLDWTRTVGDRRIARRSQLVRREAPEGLRVLFSTLVDVGQPDGTIARLPASYRLWYPSLDALTALVGEAGLAVALAYGSHDLDPLDGNSERQILVVRRAVG